MFKKTSFIALAYVCGALLSSTHLLADEQSSDEHVLVGSRNGSQEKTISKQARLQLASFENSEATADANKAENQKLAAEAKSLRDSKEGRDSLSLFAYVSSHPGAFHNIIEAPSAYSFSLEDGSVWATNSYIERYGDLDIFGGLYNVYYLVTDGYSTSIWYPSDSVVIQPNHWSGNYSYWLTNETTGVSISVNLQLGPQYNSYYKHVITWIDYSYGEIYLEDGTRWTMDSSWNIRKWLAGDTVIIGGKDSWLFSSSANTLINVNTATYAAGRVTY